MINEEIKPIVTPNVISEGVFLNREIINQYILEIDANNFLNLMIEPELHTSPLPIVVIDILQ